MSSQNRKYEQKARAESQRQTRDRIAKAAAELHEEKGVARTTVAEIARRAGVTRLTVYNHFADLSELIPACAGHYATRHPVPDFGPALGQEEPGARVRAVLLTLYSWYRETEPMLGKLFTDRAAVPELDRFMEENIDRLQAQLADGLAASLEVGNGRGPRLTGLLRLTLDFWTWRRLGLEGFDDDAAADLMAAAVERERASSPRRGAQRR